MMIFIGSLHNQLLTNSQYENKKTPQQEVDNYETMIKIVSKNLPFIDLISFVEIFSSVSKNIY